ncbi:MAG TPA: glycosyltransferase family 39 protein [Polyangiales bacterium]|nr:glycosyltransferase family 39 protein [Polyangiales bacterium]
MHQRVLRVALLTALGVLAVFALFDAATLHGHFEIRYVGAREVPNNELVFYLWYAVWGGVAVACFAAAFHATIAARLVEWFRACARAPRHVVLFASLLVFLGALLFRHTVLLNEPICDDELVYQFTARNLCLGHVTAPPPIPADFLKNQFVIVDAQRWHGKYPLGHSLLLAPFEMLGRPDLLGPIIAALSLALTYAIALRFVSSTVATLSVMLLACSPHFVWTHATLVSQTSSGLLMLAAVFASMRFRETRRDRWLFTIGAALGFGILTRPMPGVLVAAAVVAAQLQAAVQEETAENARTRFFKRAARELAFIALAALPFIGVVLWTNHVQSGSASSTAYIEVHAKFGMFENRDGELTNSVGGALVRENAWLFGWPFSLLFVAFARIERARAYFWMLVGTTIAYRLIVPKTVVATTGPIYVAESVPFLCIASAAGMAHVAALLRRLGDRRATQRVAAFVTAAFLVALLAFPRVELPPIHAGARLRAQVKDLLAQRKVERAVVFSGIIVNMDYAGTWASYPPNPWPDLRDDLLFLRIPGTPDGVRRAKALWQERFSDRPAFIWDARKGVQGLEPLDSAVVEQLTEYSTVR